MPLLNSTEVATVFDQEIKDAIAKGSAVKIVGILANDDKEARMYANMTKKACERVGIQYELRETTRLDLEEKVIEANDDPSVHGILIYYPVFGGQMDDYIQNIVSIKKDVEGMNYRYRFALYHNERFIEPGKRAIVPCTPLACVKIIEHAGTYDRSKPVGKQLEGKVVTVINRSEIVGRPLAAMLANDGAFVYSVDITGILTYSAGRLPGTIKVAETDIARDDALRKSDVVVSGVPSASFQVPTECLKQGVVCINFAPQCNFDKEKVKEIGTLCPAIGKVTIAMLQRNLVRLYDNFGEKVQQQPEALQMDEKMVLRP
mmetsp:Transcript_8731/g.24075  ORF Transcript_8731/g.24075 Transcript_8731/m.24075 type:complete len:317 (+) Transcript_8731:65-1015(+)